jgi:hypothetical protein
VFFGRSDFLFSQMATSFSSSPNICTVKTYPPLVDPKNQPPWQQPDGVLYPPHIEEDGVAIGKRPEDPQELLPRIVLTKMNLHKSKKFGLSTQAPFYSLR